MPLFCQPFYITLNITIIYLFYPASLRYNWYIALYKFKVYNVVIWYTYKSQNNYHNNFS